MERSAFEQSECAGYSRWTQIVTSVVAATLLGMALSPSLLLIHGHWVGSFAVVAFFSKLCHQRPDRSFFLFGTQTAVCIRCLGVYGGTVIGSLLRWKQGIAIRTVGGALALNGLDVAIESLHLHGNLPLLRLLIGASLGVAVGALLSTDYSTKYCRSITLPANSQALSGKQPSPR